MINLHISRVEEEQAKGYVVVERPDQWAGTDRVFMVDPKSTCLEPMRSGLKCLMDKGHRGRHSINIFYCDGCGKTRRGNPEQGNEHIVLCFMCVRGLS